MDVHDVHGPIDFLLLEFPDGAKGSETARALFELVEQGVVRLYDLMVIRKEVDGSYGERELAGMSDIGLAAIQTFADARSGLLGTEDGQEAAKALEPGSTGVLLLYENAWAIPFVAAARGDGAQVVASARLSAQEIMDTLDALDAAS